MTSAQMYAIVSNRYRIAEVLSFRRGASQTEFNRAARLRKLSIYLRRRMLRKP